MDDPVRPENAVRLDNVVSTAVRWQLSQLLDRVGWPCGATRADLMDALAIAFNIGRRSGLAYAGEIAAHRESLARSAYAYARERGLDSEHHRLESLAYQILRREIESLVPK